MPAIIGGSGLQAMPGLDITERVDIDTAWGKPSSLITVGQLGGQKVLFLARHSDEHGIPPHKVNYRANIAALAELGASCIFAFNAVGGINDGLGAGSLVVPQQIVDYTWGREHTYSDSSDVALNYVDFTEPYDAELRTALIDAAVQSGCDIARQGVYGATQGPRLESAAEITRMERDGCDIVGMTGMPEAGLAREKNLPYACLALVVNPAAGKSGRLISFEEITQVMAERMPLVNTVLAEACNSALVTQKHT
ncbi:MAG: S-methyl-5'-thioinosine phosphorylase [Porticoccaceae bacterium]|nr:S-methyl-5'-thioinosine phosphorylase [Porticoccaceae bacterium]